MAEINDSKTTAHLLFIKLSSESPGDGSNPAYWTPEEKTMLETTS